MTLPGMQSVPATGQECKYEYSFAYQGDFKNLERPSSRALQCMRTPVYGSRLEHMERTLMIDWRLIRRRMKGFCWYPSYPYWRLDHPTAEWAKLGCVSKGPLTGLGVDSEESLR